MMNEEAIAYLKKCNENLVKAAKDEGVYNYEKQVIEADCMRESFEANKKAIQALEKELVLDKIRAELIQSIQNGTLKIEGGNEFYAHKNVGNMNQDMPLYLCDPEKNTECNKGISCQTQCFHTSNPMFKKELDWAEWKAKVGKAMENGDVPKSKVSKNKLIVSDNVLDDLVKGARKCCEDILEFEKRGDSE